MAGPTAAITEVEDIGGESPGGADGMSGSGHHRCWRRRWRATTGVGDIDGGPLGVLPAGPAATTTDIGDVDGRSPGGAADRSGSGHHRS
jgi:hypothetical protein